MRKIVQRGIGGGDHLDVEPLEQGAGAEGRGSQRLGDAVVVVVRIGR